jgi:starch synthase
MPPAKAHPKPRRSVLLIGSEARPFSKTGGLADVLGALPPALQRLGWDATVALPRYRGVSAGTFVDTFPVTVGGYTRDAAFYDAPLADGARALLIDCADLYGRPGIYGVDNTDYPDNARRYAFLTRAALEYAARRETAPSIVHAHDWQAALAPVYVDTVEWGQPLHGSATMYTIHNLAYQGVDDGSAMYVTGLGPEHYHSREFEHFGTVNLTKAALYRSTLLTTVSRNYAREIETPAFGCGLDGVLAERGSDLHGVTNGVLPRTVSVTELFTSCVV